MSQLGHMSAETCAASHSASHDYLPKQNHTPFFRRVFGSEAKADAKFAPQGAWRDRTTRVDESARMPEGRRTGNVVVVIVAVIRTIRQVKRLCQQLHVDAFANPDVLCQAQIELEERISAEWIVLGNRAALRNPIQAIEAVLCS